MPGFFKIGPLLYQEIEPFLFRLELFQGKQVNRPQPVQLLTQVPYLFVESIGSGRLFTFGEQFSLIQISQVHVVIVQNPLSQALTPRAQFRETQFNRMYPLLLALPGLPLLAQALLKNLH